MRPYLLIALALLNLPGAGMAEPEAGGAARPVAQQALEVDSASRLELTPQLSVITLRELSLPFGGRNVQYTSGMEGLPSLLVTLGRPLGTWGDFNFTLQATTGLAARGAMLPVTSAGAETPTFSEMNLLWVPMLFSVRTLYRLPAVSFLRPGLTVGVGYLALFQSAADPTLNRTTGMPLLMVSPLLSFSEPSPNHWLGGFSFGFTFLNGLGGINSMAATSLDLKLNLLL